MSSHYVHTVQEGDRLNVFLDSNGGFDLQEDPAKPMIFISAGTGALGLVFLALALICQFTSITHTHIGR